MLRVDSLPRSDRPPRAPSPRRSLLASRWVHVVIRPLGGVAAALAALPIALTTGACADRRPRPEPAAGIPAPAPADTGRCADVADVRVCWPGAGEPAVVRPRAVPRSPRPVAGWRCAGEGARRRCFDRGAGGGPFVCDGDRCEQRYPRMPSDGEWECVDLAGVVVCRRGIPAAGVLPGPRDPGWICGARAGVTPAERLCVDLAPDLPDADGHWRCRFDHRGHDRRLCRRTRATAPLGRGCDARRACPPQLTCTDGRCLPYEPIPSCWLDGDCAPGARCHTGTCVASASSRAP